MIEITNISKSFGNNKVIDDVSFVFEQGKTNLIIGESGSGKTTIMNLLNRFYDVDGGEILFDEKNIKELWIN